MVKVRLYLVRHGKTMFNTIGRAQGWSDTPLTAEGAESKVSVAGVGAEGCTGATSGSSYIGPTG